MTYREHMQRCATEYLAALKAKHKGEVPAMIQEAGISHASLYRFLRRCHLVEPIVRGNEQWRALQSS